MWTKSCVDYQKSKIHRHVMSPVGTFELPRCRFSHVNIDIVAPLPLSKGFTYCLTCVDKFSWWPEVFPMTDQTVVTVAEKHSLLVRLPDLAFPILLQQIKVDSLKVNFSLNLTRLLRIRKLQTTAFNPKANGTAERFHRQLKSSIMCHAIEKWTELLPVIFF